MLTAEHVLHSRVNTRRRSKNSLSTASQDPDLFSYHISRSFHHRDHVKDNDIIYWSFHPYSVYPKHKEQHHHSTKNTVTLTDISSSCCTTRFPQILQNQASYLHSLTLTTTDSVPDTSAPLDASTKPPQCPTKTPATETAPRISSAQTRNSVQSNGTPVAIAVGSLIKSIERRR